MKGLTLPEGRTQKACLHVIQKFKQQYYKGDIKADSEVADDTGDEGATTPVSVKKAPAPRKRKAAEGGAKRGKKAKAQS